MEYKVLFEKGNCALIKRGSDMQQYAVVRNLNKENGEWDWTVGYSMFDKCSGTTEIKALQKMIELFRAKTEPDYISRSRLEELATYFKDGLIEDDKKSAMEYFDNVCEMTEEEKEFFGIEEEDEDE